MLPSQATGRIPLIGFYALFFSITGIILPFLPAYLKSLTLSVAQVGLLLSLSPLLALVAPHFWGHLADRTGRPHRVLTAVCAGACLGFIPLLFVERCPTLGAALAA
ncbi:MAG TPA: MFS transporter, partial [Archangium sp.]|nr:MFS transporter [Archangium sp.]